MSGLIHLANEGWKVEHNEVLSDYIESYRAWYKALGSWGKAANQVIILLRKNHKDMFSNRTDDALRQRISQLEKVMAGEKETGNPYDEEFYNKSPRKEWFNN
ncbi:hypothetical protein ACQKMN_17020 [Ureibacillus composti]